MRKGLKRLLLGMGLGWSSTLIAAIPVGEWRTHFSYSSANQVVLTDDEVFVEAKGKLFSYRPDGTLKTYTILDGLSGTTVSFFAWCEEAKTLMIVYADGNMDFMTPRGLINLPDFKNKSLQGDKTINGLRLYGNMAYVSTGVGLLVVDVENIEIKETYHLSFNAGYTAVKDAVVWDDSIMVITSSGLFAANQKNNLLDKAYWTPKPFLTGVNPLKALRYDNRFLVYGSDGFLYRGEPGFWENYQSDAGFKSMDLQDETLLICYSSHLRMIHSGGQQTDIPAENLRSACIDAKTKKIYYVNESNGLNIMAPVNGSYVVEQSSLLPDGPSLSTAWNGFFRDGTYYSTTGGRWGDRYFFDVDILVYENEKWHGMTDKADLATKIGYRPMDFMNLAIDPDDPGHYFITTWGDGMLEYRDSTFYKQHNQFNSPLKTRIPGRFCRVDGATFDADGNLWVLNSTQTDTTIQILMPDGTWKGLYYSQLPPSPTWNNILFTSNGQIWMNALREKYGIFVIDPKGTTFDTYDDKTRWFDRMPDQDGEVISPWTYNCITEDLNGTLWIGTNYGPFLATNTANVFSSNYYFTRIKVPRNDGTDLADYLLSGTRINCITVDGANRKWLGTNGNGVYLLSADGITTLHHFTTENSPLPSDYIWTIAINPETGEVFIGTEEGLVSYRSNATTGKADYSNVHVFPNPVKPGFEGTITVTGLKSDSQVKITDLAGNVLISGTSLGGQFGWNGYTKSGRRAGSGTYIVLCADEDGAEYVACKFMIVN